MGSDNVQMSQFFSLFDGGVDLKNNSPVSLYEQ